MNFIELKDSILGNFHFAFKIDWDNPHHRQIHTYLTSLTMYYSVKFNGHIGSAGNFLMYRFNDEAGLEEQIDKFRNLFRNESPENFSEEVCNGCHIFIC